MADSSHLLSTLANGMRWVEPLVGAVFAFEATGFALAVSLVAVTRALPMLLAGALGLVATCIAMGPVGVLSIGALAGAIGSARAIAAMAAAGLLALAATARLPLRR